MAPSIGDVAEQLLIRHHSAVELVNRLVRMELVHRYRDPDDRRRVRISLTPLAEEKLATLANVHLEELRAVRPRSEEHTSELQSIMRISYAVFCLKKKKKK